MAHDDEQSPGASGPDLPEQSPGPEASAPITPGLAPRFHRHATGAENHDSDVVHPRAPSGTPPPKSRHRARSLIVSAVGAILALAIVLGVIAYVTGGASPEASPSSAFALPPKPERCTDGVAGQPIPRSGMDVGAVLVPRASMPRGWLFDDETLPMTARAQLVGPPEPPPSSNPSNPAAPASPSTAPVTGTTPVFGLVTLPKDSGDESLRTTGEAFLQCLIHLPRYGGLEPQPPVIVSAQEDVTENGVPYVHLAARLTTGAGAGDAVYLVVVGTEPVTLAVGIAPLGDEERQEQLRTALSGVQIRAPQS